MAPLVCWSHRGRHYNPCETRPKDLLQSRLAWHRDWRVWEGCAEELVQKPLEPDMIDHQSTARAHKTGHSMYRVAITEEHDIGNMH